MVKVVINSIPTAPGGGMTIVLGLLEGWQSIGAELDVKVLVSRAETIAALERAGWRDRLCIVPHMSLVRRELWQRFVLPKLVEQLGAEVFLTSNYDVPAVPCPQVVHHQNLFTCFSRGLWPYVRVVPSVASGLWPYVRLSPVFLAGTLRARRALRRAAANVFISNHVRLRSEQLVPESGSRNFTVYNGLSAAYRSGNGSGPRRAPFRVCAVQNTLPYKDTDSLIRAFAEVVRLAPEHNWRLDIAGWGNFSGVLRQAIEFNIAGRVRWLGYLDVEQTVKLLSESVVLVFPSLFEGFGLPVIEAMAAGCAVIAVDATAIPEVSGGAAVLVPPRSPGAIAQEILRICTDDAYRCGLERRGRAWAAQFSWARTAREFCQVFARVLNRPVRVADGQVLP